MSPRVSIVIPAYKAQAYLPRAVASLQLQTMPDWEAIIISDDGFDYSSMFNDTRLRFASTGRIGSGPGFARNTGMELARADIIANLDADDAYVPIYLETVLPVVLKYGAANTDFRMLVHETGADIDVKNTPQGQTFLSMPSFLERNITYQNVIFDKRRSFPRFPDNLALGEDILFWMLLFDDIPAIPYIPQKLYHYYACRDSLSRRSETDMRGTCERREGMISWLGEGSPLKNPANREFFCRTLRMQNDIEASFNYQRVDKALYQAEMNRRLPEILKIYEKREEA